MNMILQPITEWMRWHTDNLSWDEDAVLTYRADWLAWIGMSTGFGSGEGLLNTGGGLSFSSLSSIGSSLMTGVEGGPGSGCPSPLRSEELEAGVEMLLLLLVELLRGGGPLETF